MAAYNHKMAFDATVEITKAALAANGSLYPGEPAANDLVVFMQTIYTKLSELNDAACQSKHTD